MGFLPNNVITDLLDDEDRRRKRDPLASAEQPAFVLSDAQIRGALGEEPLAKAERKKVPLRLGSGRVDPRGPGPGAQPISLDVIGTNRQDFTRSVQRILRAANEEPRTGGFTGVARNMGDLETIAENKAKAARLLELLPAAEAGAINLGLKRQSDLDRIDPSNPEGSAYLSIVGEIRQIVGSPSLEGKVSTSESFDKFDPSQQEDEIGPGVKDFSELKSLGKSLLGALPEQVAMMGGAVPQTLVADALGLGREAREQLDRIEPGISGRILESIAISEEEAAQNPKSIFFGRIAGMMPLGLINPATAGLTTLGLSASTANAGIESALVSGIASTRLGAMAMRGAAVAIENAPELTVRLTLMVESGQMSPDDAAIQFFKESAIAVAAGGALEGITGTFKGKGADDGLKARVPDGSADDLAESVIAREMGDLLVRAEDVTDVPNVRLSEGGVEGIAPELPGFAGGIARDVEIARAGEGLQEPQIRRFERPGEPPLGARDTPEIVRPGPELGQGRRTPNEEIFGAESRSQIEAEQTRASERKQLDTFLQRETGEVLGPPEKPRQRMKRGDLEESEKILFDQFERERRVQRGKKQADAKRDDPLAPVRAQETTPAKPGPGEDLAKALGDAAEARQKRRQGSRPTRPEPEPGPPTARGGTPATVSKPLKANDALASALEEATRSVEGKNLTPDVKRAVDKLPPVPKGTTRVWRWEGSGARRAGGAGGVRGGTWFEESAGVYFDPKRSKPSDGRFLDIPTALWKRLKSDPNATEVKLAKEIADTAKSLEGEPKAKGRAAAAEIERLAGELPKPKKRKLTGAAREAVLEDNEAFKVFRDRKDARIAEAKAVGKLDAERGPKSEAGPELTPKQKRIKAEDDLFLETRTKKQIDAKLDNDGVAGNKESRARLKREFGLQPGDVIDPPGARGRRQIVDAIEITDGRLRVRTIGIDPSKTGIDDFESKGFEQILDADVAAKGTADARSRARDLAEADKLVGQARSKAKKVIAETPEPARSGETPVVEVPEQLGSAPQATRAAKTMQNFSASVDETIGKYLEEGKPSRSTGSSPLSGKLKTGAPDFVKFKVGNAEFKVATNVLPEVRARIQKLTRRTPFEAGTPPKGSKAAGTSKIKEAELRKRFAGDPDVEISRFGEKGEGQILMDVAKTAHRALSFVVRNYGRSLRGVAATVKDVDASGRSVGRQIANRTDAVRNWFEPRAGTALDAVERATKKLSDSQYDNMITWLDGGARVADPDVAKAVGVVRMELNKVHASARTIGWDIGEIKNYYPHRFENLPADLAAEGAESLANVRSGNPFAQLRTRNYNLERSREQSRIGYRRDRKVLGEYFIEGYKQLSEARFLGKRGADGKFNPKRDQLRGIVELLNRVSDDGKRETLLEGFTRMTGNEHATAGGRVLRTIAEVNAFLSLSGSAIRQMEQINQLIGETGFIPVAKVVGEIVANPSKWAEFKSEALRSGATIPNIRSEVVRAVSGRVGDSGSGKGILRGFMWGINTTDGMLRVISNRTARGMLNRFKKNGRTDILELWGIRNRDITEADYARVGKMLSDKTQFRADVQDLPVGATSPGGRMVFQFQSFMHRQADWVNRIALDIAKGSPLVRERALKRAARFTLSSAVTTELLEDFRAWALNYDVFNAEELKGDLTEVQVIDAFSRAFASSERVSINTPKMRALQNIMIAGNVGLWWSMTDNVITAARRGDPLRLLGPAAQRGQRLGRQLAEPDPKGAIAAVTPTLVRKNLERFFGDLFEIAPKQRRRTRATRRQRRTTR